jgi:hypothetical protein
VVEGRVLGEEAVEHRAEQEGARALEGLLLQRHRDSMPRAAPRPARERMRRTTGRLSTRAHAPDPALGGAVGEVREEGQDLPQGLAVAPRPLLDEPRGG